MSGRISCLDLSLLFSILLPFPFLLYLHFGPDMVGYEMSEDCLYINVIRPARVDPAAQLPVAVSPRPRDETPGVPVAHRGQAELWVLGASTTPALPICSTIQRGVASRSSAQFLPRSGTANSNLVDVLKTEYINPDVPKGLDVVIMRSIQLTYKFLQTKIGTGWTGTPSDQACNHDHPCHPRHHVPCRFKPIVDTS